MELESSSAIQIEEGISLPFDRHEIHLQNEGIVKIGKALDSSLKES